MLPPDDQFLGVKDVLTLIKQALQEKRPFSFVRVGDGENIVLSQEIVKPIDEVLQIPWAIQANQGKKGIHLPNLKLRDEIAAGINHADLVGIPYWNNDPIIAPQELKRPLTEEVFAKLNIMPMRICHTFVNRVFAQKRSFWKMLRRQRVLLISGWADSVKTIISKEPYNINIVKTITFTDYSQMDKTLKQVDKLKKEFDIVLISCGVNAVILAPKIAELTGKVALDFGKSLMFIVEKKAGLEHSSYQANKDLLNQLLKN